MNVGRQRFSSANKACKNFKWIVKCLVEKQLEIIFRGKIYERKRQDCSKEYHQRKLKEVYGNSFPIKGAINTFKKLKSLKLKQIVLTGTEEWLVKNWFKKMGIEKVEVLGKEKGTKSDHLKLLRKKFPAKKFVIVSDSFRDLTLPVEIKIGLYKNKKEKEYLKEAKPDFLIKNLKMVKEILSKINA
ncbi:MAG: hypothetical protein QW156_04235 [Candidatus Aenigmatarchaeota archaeon]